MKKNVKQKTFGFIAGMSLLLVPVVGVSASETFLNDTKEVRYTPFLETKEKLKEKVRLLNDGEVNPFEDVAEEIDEPIEEEEGEVIEEKPPLTQQEIDEILGEIDDIHENWQKYVPYDVEGHWAEGTLRQFNAADYLGGYKLKSGDYEIRPNNTITRAEFASMLVRMLQLEQKGETKEFNDVKKGAWYYDSVKRVVSNGIANGKPGNNFKPNDPITRAELASMIYGAFKHTVEFEGEAKTFKDVPKKHWANSVIETVSRVGIVGGYSDGTFKPSKTATRAEAVVMLKRAMDKEFKNKETDIESVLKLAEEARHAEMFNYITSKDVGGFYETLKSHTTGAFEVEWVEYLLYLFTLEGNFGKKIEVEESGVPTFTIKQNTDRQIVVQSKGAVLNIRVTDPKTGQTIQKEENIPADANYYLKKTKDGKWKVYLVQRLSGEQYDILL